MGGTNPPAATFRDLVVWRDAHKYVLAIYSFTESFPAILTPDS